MTDQNNPDPTAIGKLAQEIVAILIDENSISRQRAIQAAMTLLGDAEPLNLNSPPNPNANNHPTSSHTDLASFFNREGGLKPSDNAHLCAAYNYSLYGTAPFSLDELRAIAMEAGVVLPDRLDMTLKSGLRKGKKLYQIAGKGLFRPTAAAGVEFAERWGVKPGNGTKTATSNRHQMD